MCRLGRGFRGNGWRWRKRLFALEEELWGECCAALGNVLLHIDTSGEWEWLLDPNAGYSVSGAYQVSTFAWHFMYGRLPTKYNLFEYNIIALASQFCGAHDFCKSTRSCFQAIWLVTVWSI
ncbi:H+-transporting two-sector ATPase alpha/beta subunit central [Trifolium medium]|uniref:H+-transporting two-sector ATPase alpha/beta subunit central n=1 Tax=Trifolium medium TaxID=97028 RepID=A0A392MZF1_9FABA|nr:H+-transporting two-sector ATPase alpha/beta subunit central [Trifolium medium]